MLPITVPPREFFNNETEEFVYEGKLTTLQLEHSLLSISKWESIWHKSFISAFSEKKESADPDSAAMIKDYVKCMTLTQNVDPSVYDRLTSENYEDIKNYISNSMTATTFSEPEGAPKRHEIITSELIYYSMIAYNIPFSCEKWHLNRLLALIKICDIKSSKPKKMSARQTMSRNRALNEARKSKYHTHG